MGAAGERPRRAGGELMDSLGFVIGVAFLLWVIGRATRSRA